MRLSRSVSESQFLLACQAGQARMRLDRSGQNRASTKALQRILIALLTVMLAAMPAPARSQALVPSEVPTVTAGITPHEALDFIYVQPTERTKLNNYVFDAFGPYPIVAVGVAAGINQWTNSPPEWGQGTEGFGKRFGSDSGIAAIDTTTRYGLAEAFREDTLYYRCECSGLFPRLRHAVVSTLIARRGEDGHRVFSFSALASPYAGSITAIYGWYPNRFGAKDAFRMGNYSLLAYMGGNIAFEFFYSGPHALISRMHLNNTHGSSIQGPNQ
jgi:hypothetical protein